MSFTDEFLDQSSMTTKVFVEAISKIPTRLSNDSIFFPDITPDDALYQVKGLTWNNQSSLQERLPDFARLIFVPCVCHMINRAIVHILERTIPITR
jgi:hypothetical protein